MLKCLIAKNFQHLRSGNISVRYKDGFLITPSGTKYSSLKIKILFMFLSKDFLSYLIKKKGIHLLNGDFTKIFI